MSQTNKLVYFLTSVKDILDFEDENEFRKKITESKDFKIKLQKLVYLSKFFGWNNDYIFTLHERGPYSVELKQNYINNNLLNNTPQEIKKFNKIKFQKFTQNKNLEYLEATATLIYTLGKNMTKIEVYDAVNLIKPLKEHIPSEIIKKAYHDIITFKLYETKHITNKDVENHEKIVNQKIKELTNYFENYNASKNRILILGSIDYLRIALREAKLNLNDEYELLNIIEKYLKKTDEISQMSQNKFKKSNFEYLEEIFNQIQEYIAEELKIIKRLDDDDFDETLCYF